MDATGRKSIEEIRASISAAMSGLNMLRLEHPAIIDSVFLKKVRYQLLCAMFDEPADVEKYLAEDQ